jgi:glyoxylase-like metal-dependent hydrolase (beta-lactamase superfamily II)
MAHAYALNEGSYSVDASKKFIPFDPLVDRPKDRPASLFVHVQPFLLDTGHELIVLDTGLGYADDNGELFIHKHIRAKGYDPRDVSKVLMSHLHFDHAAGMLHEVQGKWELSFPGADYFVQEKELETALTRPSKSYHYELTGAHSEFHQVFRIDTGEQVFFFGGDVMPEAIQVQRKFMAKYDFDGRKAMELREEYGRQAVEHNWYCLMYHDKKEAIVQFGLENGAFTVKWSGEEV